MGRLARLVEAGEIPPGLVINTGPVSKPPVGESRELSRVLAIPRTKTAKKGIVCYLSKPESSMTLRPIQLSALREAQLARGLFGALAVGSGKTLLDFLLPSMFPECKRPLILVPASLKAQAVDHWREYKKHFRIRSDFFLASYHELSDARGSDLLTELRPDLIIADECHTLRNPKAARTNRMIQYMRKNYSTRFCAMSGTITTRSLMDYGHIIEWVLKDRSPLPRYYKFWPTLREWSEAIDVPTRDKPRPAGALRKLCKKGEPIRSGFARRLRSTRGVVVSKGGEVKAGLTISILETPSNKRIDNATRSAIKTWERPDGEELVSSLEIAKVLKQLRYGGYFYWDWKPGTKEKDIQSWLSARKLFRSDLRELIARRRRFGVDSPLLAIRAIESGNLPCPSYGVWKEISSGVPTPKTTWHWLSHYLVRYVGHCTSRLGPCIIWTDTPTIGRAIARELGATYYGHGKRDARRLAEHIGKRRPARGESNLRKIPLSQSEPKGSIVCSIQAHGTGRDGLQYLYDQNIVAASISNGARFEQLIGRTHRLGQESDRVTVYVLDVFTEQLMKAKEDARYIETTLGKKQKLLYADYQTEQGRPPRSRSRKTKPRE